LLLSEKVRQLPVSELIKKIETPKDERIKSCNNDDEYYNNRQRWNSNDEYKYNDLVLLEKELTEKGGSAGDKVPAFSPKEN